MRLCFITFSIPLILFFVFLTIVFSQARSNVIDTDDYSVDFGIYDAFNSSDVSYKTSLKEKTDYWRNIEAFETYPSSSNSTPGIVTLSHVFLKIENRMVPVAYVYLEFFLKIKNSTKTYIPYLLKKDSGSIHIITAGTSGDGTKKGKDSGFGTISSSFPSEGAPSINFYAVGTGSTVSSYVIKGSSESLADRTIHIEIDDGSEETKKAIISIPENHSSSSKTFTESDVDVDDGDSFNVDFSNISKIKLVIADQGTTFPKKSSSNNYSGPSFRLDVGDNEDFNDYNLVVTDFPNDNLETQIIRIEKEKELVFRPADQTETTCLTGESEVKGSIKSDLLGYISLSSAQPVTVCIGNKPDISRIWGLGRGYFGPEEVSPRPVLLGWVYFPYNREDFEESLSTTYTKRCPDIIKPTVTYNGTDEIPSSTKIVKKVVGGESKVFLYGCAYIPKFNKTIVLSPLAETEDSSVIWIDSNYVKALTPQTDYGVEVNAQSACREDKEPPESVTTCAHNDVSIRYSFSECSKSTFFSNADSHNKLSWGLGDSSSMDCANARESSDEKKVIRSTFNGGSSIPNSIQNLKTIYKVGESDEVTVTCPIGYSFVELRRKAVKMKTLYQL